MNIIGGLTGQQPSIRPRFSTFSPSPSPSLVCMWTFTLYFSHEANTYFFELVFRYTRQDTMNIRHMALAQ